jgi:hypothetical protein
MLTIKEALAKVEAQCNDLFGPDIKDVRLEGLEQRSEKDYHLTISFLRQNEYVSPVMAATLGNYIREYKNVVIDKKDGVIRSAQVYA